jgi:hypothetical protein
MIASMEADKNRDAAFRKLYSCVIVTREIPLCPDHQVAMTQRSGGSVRQSIRYYACPVEGCKCEGKGRTTKKYC